MINIGDIDDINPIENDDKDLQIVNKTTEIHPYQEVEKLEEVNNVREVLINLDRDVVEDDNLTSIDFNTRLHDTEVGSIVALQLLHSLKVGGSSCSLITRSIKRHKVSLGGQGRKEKVDIIKGDREHDENTSGGSLFGKIKGFMGGNKNE